MIVASVLLQAAGAHDHFLLLNGPLNLRRHSRDDLLWLWRHRRRSYDRRVLRLRFLLRHLRMDHGLLLQECLRRGEELNWRRGCLHHRRRPVDVHDGLLRLLHRLLRGVADGRENYRIIVGHHLHRVRIVGLLPLDDRFLRRRRGRLVNGRGAVGMLHHLMEHFLLRLRGVRHVVRRRLLV